MNNMGQYDGYGYGYGYSGLNMNNGMNSQSTGFNQSTGNGMRSSLPGRFVRSENEIQVQEVPMDGSIGVFPLNDYSAIIAKAWNNQGTIDTVRFIPEKTTKKDTNGSTVDLNPILERLDKLENMIKKQYRPYKGPRKTNTPKVEQE